MVGIKGNDKTKKTTRNIHVDEKRVCKDNYVPALSSHYRAAQKLGTSTEEIASWRAARRKNYPTEANIKRRQLEIATKESECDNDKKSVDFDKETNCIAAIVELNKLKDVSDKSEERTMKPCFKFLRNSCKLSAEECHYDHDEQLRLERNIAARKKADQRQVMASNARPEGSPSLLKKLLASDIHKERVVLLHCLRHLLVQKSKEQENSLACL